MRSLQRLARLSWRERALLAGASALLPTTAIALKTLGLRRWQSFLAGPRTDGPEIAAPPEPRVRFGPGRTVAVRLDGDAPAEEIRFVLRSLAAGARTAAQARRIACLLEAVMRRMPYRPNCLQRSVTLWWMLRRSGIDSEVRIGTRWVQGEFQAHAWVETGSAIINESDAVREQYTVFDRGFTAQAPGAVGRARAR